MKDLSAFFEWSRTHPMAHTKPPTYRTTLLVDDSPYKCIPNPPGCYINPPSFTSNQSLAPLHSYLQRLVSSEQYVPDFVGSNPYPSGQGPFNLELPSSLIFEHSMARHKTLTFDCIVPEAQMILWNPYWGRRIVHIFIDISGTEIFLADCFICILFCSCGFVHSNMLWS